MIGTTFVLHDDLDLMRRDLADLLPRLGGHRLLITGGAGLLGYYLVQIITHLNDDQPRCGQVDLTICDNYKRGAPGWLTAIGERGAARVVVADVSKPLPPKLGPFDYVIHATDIAHPMVYRRYPLETIDANINGLRFLLESARTQADQGRPVRGFLFYSSSEIYGDPVPAAIPTPE